jgi:Bacterial capsule synthesis protein PGA_cap
MRPLFLLLATFLVLNLPLAALDVQVPGAFRSAWERLISEHPVPPGMEPGSIIVQDTAQDNVPAGFKVVETAIMVPVARFWEMPAPVTRSRAESGGVRLLPIENVALPDIALPVDGLFPGDPGYPLVRVLAVGIQGDDPALVRWFESLPPSRPEALHRIIWVGAVGDVMPDRGVDEDLLAPPGVQRVFGDTLPVLRGLAFLAGNLEAAATGAGVKMRKTYTFRFDPRALDRLALAGFSYLSLANNHTFDYGAKGFIDTLEGLSAAGIATSGAGRTDREASQPAVLSAAGLEIRVLSFAAYPVDRTGFDGRAAARATGDRPGTLWLDEEGLAAAARGFSPLAFNIALVHGGIEWSTTPTDAQRQDYRQLIRAGADLVIGSHPHVLQGLEADDGRLIAYSLGNFLFPGMDGTPGGESSAILEVGIWDRKIVSVRLVPVRLNGRAVRLDLRQGIVAAVRSLSLALNTPQ